MILKIKILLPVFILLAMYSIAQETKKLQVVSYTVDKTISNKNISYLIIDGNKANVTVKGWNKPEIVVKYIFTAKHQDKSIAENDIKAFSYKLQESGTKLYAGTSINIWKKKSSKTVMKCDIEILVPASCKIKLENSFAVNRIENITGDMYLNTKYGSLLLSNISGSCEVMCNYNDVTATRMNTDLTADLQNSNISIDGILNGTYKLKGNFCNAEIQNVQNMKNMNCKIDNGSVDLQLMQPALYSYEILAQAGQITNLLPESIKKKSKNTTYEFNFKPSGVTNKIYMNCIYSNIKLK